MSLNPGSSSFEKRVVDIVQVWDAATGQRVRNIPVMQPVTITGSITESGSLGDQSRVIAWALNEQYLAAAKSRQDAANGKDYEVIEIWDIATGSKVSTLDPALSPTATPGSSISTPPNTPTPTPPNTPTPMATPQNGASTSTPPNTPTPTNTPTTSYVEVQKMVWAPDSGKLAVFTTVIAPDVAVTNICQMWDAPAGKKMHAFTVMDQADEIIAWSLDGRSIALGTAVYDVETGRRRAAYTVEGRLTSQAWSPDGKRLAVSSFTYRRPYVPVGTIYIVDASSGRQIAMYDEGQIDPIDNMPSSPRKMVWSPNGKDFLVVRKGIEIWRVE